VRGGKTCLIYARRVLGGKDLPPFPLASFPIECTRQDFLQNAFRVARRCFPSAVHVEDMEFVVFLVYAHDLSSPGDFLI
jgi:hypothetical protein